MLPKKKRKKSEFKEKERALLNLRLIYLFTRSGTRAHVNLIDDHYVEILFPLNIPISHQDMPIENLSQLKQQ